MKFICVLIDVIHIYLCTSIMDKKSRHVDCYRYVVHLWYVYLWLLIGRNISRDIFYVIKCRCLMV